MAFVATGAFLICVVSAFAFQFQKEDIYGFRSAMIRKVARRTGSVFTYTQAQTLQKKEE